MPGERDRAQCAVLNREPQSYEIIEHGQRDAASVPSEPGVLRLLEVHGDDRFPQ
jgi:hypothetical protein